MLSVQLSIISKVKDNFTLTKQGLFTCHMPPNGYEHVAQ